MAVAIGEGGVDEIEAELKNAAADGSQGDLVSAFRVDGNGRAKGGGSYTIPGNVSNGVTFTLLGARSNASATVVVKVDNSGGAADVPPQPKYTLPGDLQK